MVYYNTNIENINSNEKILITIFYVYKVKKLSYFSNILFFPDF